MKLCCFIVILNVIHVVIFSGGFTPEAYHRLQCLFDRHCTPSPSLPTTEGDGVIGVVAGCQAYLTRAQTAHLLQLPRSILLEPLINVICVHPSQVAWIDFLQVNFQIDKFRSLISCVHNGLNN